MFDILHTFTYNKYVLRIFSGIDPVAMVQLKRVKEDEVALGADIQLKCQITGNPEPSYEWLQNGYR
jgi:hypothetical protein